MSHRIPSSATMQNSVGVSIWNATLLLMLRELLTIGVRVVRVLSEFRPTYMIAILKVMEWLSEKTKNTTLGIDREILGTFRRNLEPTTTTPTFSMSKFHPSFVRVLSVRGGRIFQKCWRGARIIWQQDLSISCLFRRSNHVKSFGSWFLIWFFDPRNSDIIL